MQSAQLKMLKESRYCRTGGNQVNNNTRIMMDRRESSGVAKVEGERPNSFQCTIQKVGQLVWFSKEFQSQCLYPDAHRQGGKIRSKGRRRGQ